jgi:stage II sporulation protein R
MKWGKTMKRKYYFCLSATLLLMAFLIAMSGLRRRNAELASHVAPKILRFHVLANSGSPEDQALKLEVKDLLLQEIQAGIEAYAPSSQDISKEMLAQFILENRTDLEETANTYMKRRGFDYKTSILLERCEFPEKTYGDMTFPAGTYDAVRVLLGEGRGKNFWCVLYPSLCYLDSTHAVVPEESRQVLKAMLTEDDFLALCTARRHGLFSSAKNARQTARGTRENTEGTAPALPKLNIRFKLPELLHMER